MNTKSVLLWAMTGLVFILVTVIGLNIETWAEKKGLDEILIGAMDSVKWPSWMGWREWATLFLIFFSGAAVALWINRLLPDKPRPNDNQRELLGTLFRSSGKRAMESCMLGAILNGMRGEETKDHLSDVTNKFVWNELHHTLSQLENALVDKKTSFIRLQKRFVEFYKRYTIAVEMTAQLLPYFPDKQLLSESYRIWSDYDRRFIAGMEDVVARSDMKILKTEIETVGWGRQHRQQIEQFFE